MNQVLAEVAVQSAKSPYMLHHLDNEIFKDSIHGVFTKAEWNSYLQNPNYIILEVFYHNQVAGFCLCIQMDHIDLLKIGILKPYRRKGCASFLLKELQKLKKTIFLEVEEFNHSAIQIYLKHDFSFNRKRLFYYSNQSHAWEMVWHP
ncbi:MAG: GNAT family N-acetyltransferase [Candidatus Hydrogenedentota bacterium]|nr:MAG: GNAT family N-acetyltransferase [Candidatus Hydrogenedentota bacterium]